MSKFKVCVYAICKNEEQFVERWMDSMKEADLVIVTDTGSTDQTIEALEARGAIVYKEVIHPWRFDVARNISLEHVPVDVDICVCTDLDEILVAGWREKLEQVWEEGMNQGKYLYNWSLKLDGTPDVQFTYFKIHDRKFFKWVYPVHEVLQYIGDTPCKEIFIEGLVLNHYPDPSKSRGSYLGILEMAVEENPEDDRMVYYLGREYMYKAKWQECIETLTKYLKLKAATWKEERCAAMRWIAASYGNKGDTQEAYNWYYRAIAEVPHMREAYVELARCAYFRKDWETTFFMAREALKINKKSDCYINMGYAWDHTPDDLAALGAYNLGIYDKALEHAEKAVAITPEDKRLKSNLELIRSKYLEKSKHQNANLFTEDILVHTLLLLFREEQLVEDKKLAARCLRSLEAAQYKSVVVYNQGCLSNEELRSFLADFKLQFIVIGGMENVGVPVGRQRCFEYIWENVPNVQYVSELHLDMIFTPKWEEKLVEYLQTHDEPMISCGIIDKDGEMKFIDKIIKDMPEDEQDLQVLLKQLTSNQVVHGFTNPCIHNNHILKETGGYNLKFLKGKQCFEDDSILLSYYYYYGTRANWYPKISYESVVYHAVALQRLGLTDSVTINFNGLIKQYGAMGLKHLSQLHKSEWHIAFFKEQFNKQ